MSNRMDVCTAKQRRRSIWVPRYKYSDYTSMAGGAPDSGAFSTPPSPLSVRVSESCGSYLTLVSSFLLPPHKGISPLIAFILLRSFLSEESQCCNCCQVDDFHEPFYLGQLDFLHDIISLAPPSGSILGVSSSSSANAVLMRRRLSCFPFQGSIVRSLDDGPVFSQQCHASRWVLNDGACNYPSPPTGPIAKVL